MRGFRGINDKINNFSFVIIDLQKANVKSGLSYHAVFQFGHKITSQFLINALS